MKLQIEKIVAGGSGFSRFDGKAVFIPDVLPDEIVEAEIILEKKDFVKAKAIRLIEKSPHRIKPACKFFGKCGGCNIQFADYEYQIELKLAIICDIFERARIPIEKENIIVHKSRPWEYRSRFQLHKTQKNECGFKSRNDQFVVPITDCPLAVPEIRSFLQKGKMDSDLQRFNIFAANSRVICEGNKNETNECSVKLLNQMIQFDIRSFFQSNLNLLEDMLLLVTENIAGNSLADLYCGSGIFALFSCIHNDLDAKQITLVEQDKIALGYVQKNFVSVLGESLANIFALSCKDWVKSFAKASYDTIIVDPPRSGLETGVCTWLCKNKAQKLCYVSCNPVTLARDAVKLFECGYEISSFHFFDFYPQTSHIECLVCFSTTTKR